MWTSTLNKVRTPLALSMLIALIAFAYTAQGGIDPGRQSPVVCKIKRYNEAPPTVVLKCSFASPA